MAGRNAQRKLGAQALAFLLMMIPPIGLYLTMGQAQHTLTWILLGMIGAGFISRFQAVAMKQVRGMELAVSQR
jgi:uncharacterized membrane protein YqaE (UPF0057 family)